MENWKEYRKEEIPRGKYKAKVVCGDSHLLTVELKSDVAIRIWYAPKEIPWVR